MSESLRPSERRLKRIDAGRFVEGEIERRDEEVAAFRAAVLTTGVRDHAAAPAVADLLGIEEVSVYNMSQGRTKKNPVSDFCRFIETCIAVKGNERALEPVRLVFRRYIVGAEDVQGPGLVDLLGALLGGAAEVVDEARRAEADGVLQPDERSELRKRCERMRSVLDQIDKAIGGAK